MSSSIRQWIRRERNRVVRAHLEAQGYCFDYWLVYRVDVRAGELRAAPGESRPQRLRAAARGSSRRRHEERMALRA